METKTALDVLIDVFMRRLSETENLDEAVRTVCSLTWDTAVNSIVYPDGTKPEVVSNFNPFSQQA